MTWVCYLLKCGITNDLDKRIAAHNAGDGAKYTRSRTPVELLFSEACEDRSAASKREMQIKKLSRTAKLILIQKS
jgi:putative endonuclease